MNLIELRDAYRKAYRELGEYLEKQTHLSPRQRGYYEGKRDVILVTLGHLNTVVENEEVTA